jgi:rhodanese-related sulfurtransferase/peroxiredoxin
MFRELTRFKPIQAGNRSPALSLTADEGTWVKLSDFESALNVVLIFAHYSDSKESVDIIKNLNANLDRFRELDTAVYCITNERPEELRRLRNRLHSDIFYLYDPMALTSRSFGCAGKIRPHARDAVVVVAKNKTIAYSQNNYPEVEQLISICEKLEGRKASSAEEQDTKKSAAPPSGEAFTVLEISSDDAIKKLKEKDSLFKMIDVRTLSEFNSDHSTLAVHMPVDELSHRYRELEQSDYLIFICQAGGRASAAAEFMSSIGSQELYVVVGGMSGWTGDRDHK